MHIDSSYSQLWYDASYLISFLLAAFLILYFGYKRKYPMAQWSLVYLILGMAFSIGTYLGTYSATDWNYLFTHGELVQAGHSGRTILGGLLVGIFAYLFVVRRFLKFTYPVLDSVAYALPLGMAIQRIGCIKVGCCHGLLEGSSWGFTYDPGSLVWMNQLSAGLIHANDAHSICVAPTQAMHLISGLIAALLVFIFRKKFKASGSLALFSLTLILFSRFFIEFLADPTTNNQFGETVFYLKKVQWALAISVIILFISILIKEKYASRSIPEELSVFRRNFINPNYLIPAYLLIFLIFLMISRELQNLEYFKLSILLSITGTIQMIEIIRSHQSYRRIIKYTYAFLFVSVMIYNGHIFSQVFGMDFEKRSFEGVQKKELLELGLNTTRYQAYHSLPSSTTTGCNSVQYHYSTPEFTHAILQPEIKYQFISRKQPYPKQWTDHSFTFGLYPGVDVLEFDESLNAELRADASYTYESRMFGLDVGLMGFLNLDRKFKGEYYIYPANQYRGVIAPNLRLRLLSKRYLYFFMGYGNHYGSQLLRMDDNFPINTGLGTSFGTYNKALLEIGTTLYGPQVNLQFKIGNERYLTFGYEYRGYPYLNHLYNFSIKAPFDLHTFKYKKVQKR